MSNIKYVLTFYFSRIFFRNKREEKIAGETKVKERSRKEKKKERKKEKKKRNMKLHDWMLYCSFLNSYSYSSV